MVDNDAIQHDLQGLGFDQLVKTRWLIETLTSNFRDYYHPGEYICVAEMIVPYSGRYCKIKQYMKAKPTLWIKVWALCCSVSKYVYNLEVYLGKEDERAERMVGTGYGVVMRLVVGLDYLWHTVVCDNLFSSPRLFEDLLARGFYAVGSARKGRKGFLTSLNVGDKEAQGTLHIRMHHERQICAIHWTDNRGVHLLSTGVNPVGIGSHVLWYSGCEQVRVPRSPIVIAYNTYMWGVDVEDQMRGSYSCQ